MWWLLDLPVNLRRYIIVALVVRRHLRRYPRLYGGGFLLLLLLGNGYLALYHFYIQPARNALTKFYEAIDDEQYEVAWGLLDDDLKKRWKGGYRQFSSGYVTTVKHTDLDVSDQLSLRQLHGAMFGKCLDLDIRYRVIDRFDRQTFSDPMQRHNEVSLELRHPLEYRQMMERSLPNDMATVELTRAYEKQATVSCKRGQWRISSITPRTVAFEYERR